MTLDRYDHDHIAAFRDAIASAGLQPPDDVIADGLIHRFASDGRPHDDAGYYRLYPDDPVAGYFGCWRNDVYETWCSKGSAQLTEAERRLVAERNAAAKIEREQAKLTGQAAAASKAAEFWSKGARPTHHPYLEKKRITAHVSMTSGSMLMVPMRDETGSLVNIQMIDADGLKRFLPGGKVKGCSCTLPGQPKRHIICEGFATGATLAEVSGATVHVAFTAGNLLAVAEQVRLAHPATPIIVAADDDYKTANNPGRTKADEAALACGGQIAVPCFGPDRGEKATDFNDLFVLEGADAVIKCLRATQAPNAPRFGGSAASPAAAILEWEEPVPLPTALPPVQPFAEDLLPDSLRPWIMDIAERMQCPPDFPAVGAVAGLSSLIGARILIQPKEHDDDWKVTPTMWGINIGRPGVLKSPAVAEVMRPLQRLEEERHADWAARHEAWEVDNKHAALIAAANEKKAGKLLQESPDANVNELLAKVEVADEPQLRRFIVNDTSVEALGEVLERNPWGLLAFRDEIYGLLKAMDREGQEGARAFYLQAFDGDKPYTFDRIGRGLNRRIPRVCLSMLGNIQPGRLTEYVRSAVVGGGGDDGLIQRFQLAVWPDHNPSFKNVDRPGDAMARERALAVYRHLANLPLPAEDCALILKFDSEAQPLFNAWRQKLEERVRGDEMHPAVQSHLAKYRKLVPALALIFELVDGGTATVTRTSLARALRWADYLESHANRVYAEVSRPQIAGAEALLARLRRGQIPAEFSLRDVYLKGWSQLCEPEAVRRAAEVLVEFGWIAPITRPTKGRPSKSFLVHPALVGTP